MSFLNNLWRDLVDKRLWPVALALLVAVVAVPVLIGSGGDAEPVAATAPPPVENPAVGAQIAVATDGDEEPRTRAGSARDPFKALVFAKADKPAAGADSTSAAGAASAPAPAGAPADSGATGSAKVGGGDDAGSGSGSTPSTPSPGPSTTTPTRPGGGDTTPSTSPKIRYFNYTIGLQLKRAGRVTSRGKVRAVSYLPSATYPLVAFLGVKTDGKTASFMLAPGVLISGEDRVCRPSRANCRILELQAGDNVLLAKSPPAGQPLKRFRLMITRVGLTRVLATTTKASAARSTRSAAAARTRGVPVTLAPLRQVAAG